MKRIISICILFAILGSTSAQEVMKKNPDGTYIINTTTLAKDVVGYNGATPLEIHIKKDVITDVVPLKNDETPGFFERVKQLMLPKYKNMSVKNFSKDKVDAVTGATYSSQAVQENMSRGIDYYRKNKK